MRTNLKAAILLSSLIVLGLLWQLLVMVSQLDKTTLGEDLIFYVFFLIVPLLLVLLLIARSRIGYFLTFIYSIFYLVAGLYGILLIQTMTCCQVRAVIIIIAVYFAAFTLARYSHRSYRGLY